MSTRIMYLNKDAPAPAILPTSKRFRLVPPGGIRISASNVNLNAGKIMNFINVIDGITYAANSAQYVATVEAINGVNVAKFDPTLAVTPTGYSLQNFGFTGLNAPQFTFASMWKVTDFGAKPRETIAVAYNAAGTSQRAQLREDVTGVPQAAAKRASADALAIATLPNPTRIGGWTACAAYYDFLNNKVTIYDLLGTGSASAAIVGTAGASPSDIDGYRIGNFSNDHFVGYQCGYHHLPGAFSNGDLLALRLHMQARAKALAGL